MTVCIGDDCSARLAFAHVLCTEGPKRGMLSVRQFEAERLKYPLSKYLESIKFTQRIRLMNVLVKYQIKFGCLIVLLLTTKVIDRLCYTSPTLILLHIPTLHI